MSKEAELHALQEKNNLLEKELNDLRKQNIMLTDINARIIYEHNEGRLNNTTLEIKKGKTPAYWYSILDNIYESSKEAILVFNLTEEKLISVNDRAVEVFEAESINQFNSILFEELHVKPISPEEIVSFYSELSITGKLSKLNQYKTFKGKEFWGSLQIQGFKSDGSDLLVIRILDVDEELKIKESSITLLNSYKQLTESINNIAIATFNTDFQCTMMSGEYASKLGLKASFCEGKYIAEFVSPDYKDKNILALNNAKNGKSKTYYFLFNEQYTQADIVPIKNTKGEVHTIMVLLQDRTTEYEREQTLKLNEELLNGSFMESPVAMALVDINTGEFVKKNNFSNKLFHKYKIPQQATYFQLVKALPFDNLALQEHLLKLKENQTFYEQAKFNYPNNVNGYLQIAMRKIDINNLKYALFIITDITEHIQKQQQLQDSQELLNALYNNTSFGLLLIKKTDFTIQGANTSILDLINCRSEYDIIGKEFDSCFSSLLTTLNQRTFALLMADQSSIKGETSGTDANGKTKHFSFEIIKIQQNQIEYFLLNISDTTEKIKHELQLLESKNLLKTVVEASPFQTFLCETDNLNVIMANKSGYLALGYSSYEEIKGASIQEWSKIIFPEDIHKWNNAIAYPIEGSFDVQVMLPNATESNWFTVYISHIETENGKLRLVKGADITEKKRLTNDLLKSQQIISEIFNQSTDAIFVRKFESIEGLVCNQVALDLFEAKDSTEFASKELSAYAADDWNEENDKEFVDEIIEKGVFEVDFHYKTLSGNTFWGYTRVKTFYINDELYILYIVTDISEFKQKAELLEENEKNFKQIFYNNPQAMFIIESDSDVIVDANNAALKQYGYSAETFFGLEMSALGGCSSDKMIFDNESQIENYGIVTHLKADGSTLFIDLKKTKILRLAPGNYKLCIANDITQLKQTEQKLIESNYYLENIINTDPNPIFVKDLNGTLLLVNTAFAKLAKKPVNELLSKNEKDLYSKDELSVFAKTDKSVLEGKQLYSFEQTQLNSSTGKNEYFVTYKSPLILQDNKVNILGVMVDVTSQKEAELEMARRGQLFNFVFNNSTDALFIVDTRSDYIMDVNERTLQTFGYSTKQDFIGKKGPEFQKRDFTKEELISIRKDVEKAGGFTREIEFKRKDNSVFWGSIAGSIFTVSSQQYYLIRVLNIQKSREYQEALANSVHEKEVLIKEVHHRVKNNMAVISGLLQLQSSYFKDKETREAFKDAQNRIKGMALIHEMLYQTESLTHINFGRYINSLVGNIQRSMNQACPIYLNLDISDDIIDLVSAVPCGLIINELITNCYKHAFADKEKGNIWITYKLIDTQYQISVKDDGVGLPDEKLNLKKQNSLGMILITELTRQLKGTIDISSENGTEYQLLFPAKV